MKGFDEMLSEDFTKKDGKRGKAAALVLFYLTILYVVVLVIGLLTLKSPEEPIHDPYFTIMELLILISAPLYVFIMAEVHAYAARECKALTLTALVMTAIMACITCCVHFLILSVSRSIESETGLQWMTFIFSFKWPSVLYALDILAWDFFFGFAALFAAPVFKGGKLQNAIRVLLIISGVLCFAGLLGPVLGNMQIRNIGIIGYAVVFPVAGLLLAKVFGQKTSREKQESSAS